MLTLGVDTYSRKRRETFLKVLSQTGHTNKDFDSSASKDDETVDSTAFDSDGLLTETPDESD
jgi:hypothetical protein